MNPARKLVKAAAQRRIDITADRSKARALRSQFPDVEQIQIELSFAGSMPVPSPQSHSLYPAAQAFFRFPCPFVDCDGELDLSAPVNKAAEAAQTRGETRSVHGTSSCEGVHWRDSQQSVPCPIEFRYRIRVKKAA